MTEDTGRHAPNHGAAPPNASSRRFNGKATLKSFLRQIIDEPYSMPKSVGKQKKDLAGGSWLKHCCEQSMDAVTLQDSLRWQKCIVAALTDVIENVARKDLRPDRKSGVLFQLMHERARHNHYIDNIEEAMRRNEIVIWPR